MRNELNAFGYLTPTSVSDAVSLLTKYGGSARILAGGTDILYQMKQHIENLTPQYLVDISELGLDNVSYDSGSGLTIGATASVLKLKDDPNVNQYYPALAQAATGHPVQIASQATVGGNISQEVWCWYLRNNYDCWRNGGNVCYATVGDNRYYHSLFGGNLCYAVHASDLSTALFAYDATVTVQGPGGSYTKTMDQFLPGVSIVDGKVKENSLRYNEIVTQINVPAPTSGTLSSFFRMTDRGAVDFPLASAAVVVTTNGSTISGARVVLGHVATKPLRAHSAESYLNGQTLPLSDSALTQAAENALSAATPLTHVSTSAAGPSAGQGNGFRVYIAQGVVKNALRALSA